MRITYSFREHFMRAWNAFMDKPTLAILGPFVFLIILVSMVFLPWIKYILPFFFVPPLVGGLGYLAYNIVNYRDPSIKDIFKGFMKFGHFMIAFWGYAILIALVGVPFFAGQYIGVYTLVDMIAADYCPMTLKVIIVLAMVTGIIAYISLLVGLSFVFFVITEQKFQGSAFNAFGISLRITRGNRLKLFFTLIFLSIFTSLGIVFFVIGILPTLIFSFMMMASIYEDLKYAEPSLSRRAEQIEEDVELAIG